MMELPSTPSLRLDGKRVLVTGASSGIGLGCAVALAEAGAHVTLAARGLDKLNEVQEAFAAKGFNSTVQQMDIGDVEKTRQTIAVADPFDVLICSAGIARHSPALETTVEDYDAVMNVNVRGTYFLCQAVAKKLIDTGKPGSLILISSQMGQVGGIDRAVYCASKHALDGMQKSMAIEWGPHQVRINSICPTFIRTPLAEVTLQNPERRKWVEEKIKLGRVGESEDIMGAAVYLASAASDLVTGTSILVDGGWTAG